MNIGQALAMLDAFASVGVTAFDVTLTSLEGEPRRFRPNRSFDDLRGSIGRMLQDAERDQQNVIIRPRCKTAALIQLDDLTTETAAKLAPLSFMVLLTSPGNCQAWVAVKDAPAGKGGGKGICAETAQRGRGRPNRNRRHADFRQPQFQNDLCAGISDRGNLTHQSRQHRQPGRD